MTASFDFTIPPLAFTATSDVLFAVALAISTDLLPTAPATSDVFFPKSLANLPNFFANAFSCFSTFSYA